MSEKTRKEKKAKQKILDAGLEEFAAYGFEGARVDRIARKADINKAMIFYYFSSKQNLYRTVIKEVFLDFIPRVKRIIEEARTPERLFESLPSLYIRYFASRKEVIKIIGRELIHSPQNITPLIRDTFTEVPDAPSKMLPKVIQDWHSKGLVSESDPVQFIFNIVPLCLFPLIAQPMVEAILDVRISDDKEFLERRIQSITHLLKRGMLP
jgi:TetR/AcrR family transcriptional regulator